MCMGGQSPLCHPPEHRHQREPSPWAQSSPWALPSFLYHSASAWHADGRPPFSFIFPLKAARPHTPSFLPGDEAVSRRLPQIHMGEAGDTGAAELPLPRGGEWFIGLLPCPGHRIPIASLPTGAAGQHNPTCHRGTPQCRAPLCCPSLTPAAGRPP